jgi:hypothetical protein
LADAEVPPLLSSFDEASLVAARDAAPLLPRALLLDALGGDWRSACARSSASHSTSITKR